MISRVITVRTLQNFPYKNFIRKLNEERITYEKTLNNVQLLGRVGAEPQKKGTDAHPLVTFSLATHANYKNEAGEFSQKVEWHHICVFKPNLRDTVYNFLRKGQRVYVSGKIMYGELRDSDSSIVKSTTSILADDVIFFQTV